MNYKKQNKYYNKSKNSLFICLNKIWKKTKQILMNKIKYQFKQLKPENLTKVNLMNKEENYN